MVGILTILAGVIVRIVCPDLFGQGEETASAIFFVFLAVGVPLLCYGGLEKSTYEVSEYNRMHNPDEREKEARKKIGFLCACPMLTASFRKIRSHLLIPASGQ